jgi:ATP-dependent Clp protease ATP-binding subunit ClpA
VYFLHQQGVSRLDVVNYISHGITKAPQAPGSREENEAETEAPEAQAGGALESFTQNLNQLAIDGKIDPLIGREASWSASCRSSAGAARTIRSSWARRALARRPSPKGSPSG